MGDLQSSFASVDVRLTNWMARYGILLLRLSLGVVYIWFGVLKFFPGLSPAQELATETIEVLTFGLIPASASIVILAAWETLIGLGLITGLCMRATLLLLWLQMAGTITPFFFFPDQVFTHIPYGPTFEGQYIIKNLVIIGASIVIGATIRGGRLVPHSDTDKAPASS